MHKKRLRKKIGKAHKDRMLAIKRVEHAERCATIVSKGLSMLQAGDVPFARDIIRSWMNAARFEYCSVARHSHDYFYRRKMGYPDRGITVNVCTGENKMDEKTINII